MAIYLDSKTDYDSIFNQIKQISSQSYSSETLQALSNHMIDNNQNIYHDEFAVLIIDLFYSWIGILESQDCNRYDPIRNDFLVRLGEIKLKLKRLYSNSTPHEVEAFVNDIDYFIESLNVHFINLDCRISEHPLHKELMLWFEKIKSEYSVENLTKKSELLRNKPDLSNVSVRGLQITAAEPFSQDENDITKITASVLKLRDIWLGDDEHYEAVINFLKKPDEETGLPFIDLNNKWIGDIVLLGAFIKKCKIQRYIAPDTKQAHLERILNNTFLITIKDTPSLRRKHIFSHDQENAFNKLPTPYANKSI